VAETVYLLCFFTSAAVAVMLLRAYFRSRARILLWSGLGFVGLCLNNLLLVVDMMVIQSVDLSVIRNIPAVLGMAILVYGLIWDTET
jgi:hypothetical protein